MRLVIQRVSRAEVLADGILTASIGRGLLLLLGIEEADEQADIDWLCRKVTGLRIFNDEQGVMNRSVMEVDGDIIVVSQFTLHASTKKGNRPSYIRAAGHEKAVPMYENFIKALENSLKKPVGSGTFGAHMEVSLVNDGPVTILIDSRQKE